MPVCIPLIKGLVIRRTENPHQGTARNPRYILTKQAFFRLIPLIRESAFKFLMYHID
jgi:hypothetical protein